MLYSTIYIHLIIQENRVIIASLSYSNMSPAEDQNECKISVGVSAREITMISLFVRFLIIVRQLSYVEASIKKVVQKVSNDRSINT